MSSFTPVTELEPKDPASIAPYEIDWANGGPNDGGTKDFGWLQGRIITASTWVVPAGITSDAESFDDTTTTILLSGGTDQVKYDLVNTVAMTGGHQEPRTITIPVNTR